MAKERFHRVGIVVGLGAAAALYAAASFAQVAPAAPPANPNVINVGELLAPWLQILMAAFMGLVLALFTYLTGVLKRKAGIQETAALAEMERHARETLQSALENAGGKVIMMVGDKLKDTTFDARHPAIVAAVAGVNRAALDAVTRFNLSDERIAQMVIDKLGVLTAANPVASPQAKVTPLMEAAIDNASARNAGPNVARMLPLFVVFPLVALLLGACQTAQAPVPGAIVVDAAVAAKLPAPTKVDAAIARNAAKLSEVCLYARMALGAVGFTISAENRAYVDQAAAAVNSYCSGPPPTDVRTALYALGEIYANVMAVRAPPVRKG